MPRSAASIQTAIDALEAEILKATKVASAGVDGGNVVKQPLSVLNAELRKLYMELGRATGKAPMFPRGVVTGMR